ncbi:hypothetical protein WJX81_003995 [Elliptochloris bilobata]|uniref:Protein kinase domain-containing protein n=1 Tax=Elliptochloris bilobata TaxID=381761 RepID=A0AAW1RN43_9CHLO
MHVDFPRTIRRTAGDVYWFEWHGIDLPDGVKLPGAARAYCSPPEYIVAVTIIGFSRMATVAGTWGWVSSVSYIEPHGLVSGTNTQESYYGDYNINENLTHDVTWLDVCPRRTRMVGVEAYMAAGAVLGLSWGCGCLNDCSASHDALNITGITKNSGCSCASFFNVTSGSGLVVTESGGACVLSDSNDPWCVVNLTTCAAPRAVRRNRGETWDYCTEEAGRRALLFSYPTAQAQAGQGPLLAPILGSVIPVAVLAALAAVLVVLWWRRRRSRSKRSLTPSGKERLPHDSDAILTPNSSGPFPANMENIAEYMVKPSDFKILQRKDGSDWLLGQGAFGKVYRGLLDHVQPVAIKIIPAGIAGATPRASVETIREITLLRQCRCPHVVQFMGACVMENGDTVILMELMLGGTLFEAIATDRVSWHNRGRQVAIDVARGLAFLHSRNIASLDVKSPNVLLTPSRSAKIADFGLARVLLTAATAVTACGSFDWAAPELLMGGTSSKVSGAADIYSFGVILWELVTREAPRRGRMRVPKAPEECSEAMMELINQCMAIDASARPSARELVERLLEMGRISGSA